MEGFQILHNPVNSGKTDRFGTQHKQRKATIVYLAEITKECYLISAVQQSSK